MAQGKFQTVVDAIAADAGEDGPASAPQTSFTAVGDLEAGRRLGPPRVVWVARSAKIEATEEQQSEETRTFAERHLTCEVTCLGADLAQAEQLLADFGAGLFRTQTQLAARLTAEAHNPGGLSGANRYEIMLTVELDLPMIYGRFTRGEYTSNTNTASTGTVTD